MREDEVLSTATVHGHAHVGLRVIYHCLGSANDKPSLLQDCEKVVIGPSAPPDMSKLRGALRTLPLEVLALWAPAYFHDPVKLHIVTDVR